MKAQHIAVFNTEHLSAMFERVIIASGTSNRQTKALAASVRDSVRSNGFQVLSTEGETNGEWIIVDCGAAVVHLMQPAIREYYHLEEIWGGKNVKMKLGVVNAKLVKASEPDKPEKPASKTAAKKAAAKTTARPAAKAPAKTAAKRPAVKPGAGSSVRKTATKTATKTAGKTPVKSTTKTTERKAADKSAAYQRVGARRPTAKTAGAATPARKTPARKTAARKTPRSS